MLSLFGWVAALLIGVSLGLVGGGGSILTLPTLTYLFVVPASAATGYSLFVVGVTSAFGAIPYLRRGEARPATAAAFAIPSLVAVFSVRHWLVPALPVQFHVGPWTLSKDTATLLVFAALMVGAGYRMIASGKVEPSHRSTLWIASAGLCVGLLAGLLGAGGGFLTVPVLALGAGLEMRSAVGTSLVIIALQSGVGFAGDLLAHPSLDWRLLVGVTALAVAGALLGGWLGRRVSGSKLKPAFGWFVLAIATVIVAQETFFHGR